jgi:GNAT superfamily N-acetyltransferase
MKLHEIGLDEAASLTTFYNRQTENVPYSFPVTPSQFEAGIRTQRYSDDPLPNLYGERIFVAKEGGEILGYSHAALDNDDDGRRGETRFFGYKPGRRDVGQALLEAAERYYVAEGMSVSRLFPNPFCYRFYHVGWGVAETLLHVSGLFAMNGYRPFCGEILLEWPNFEPRTPKPFEEFGELRFEETQGRGSLPNLEMRLFENGKQVGECEACSFAHFQHGEAAERAFLVKWLGVRERAQGKRIGKHLLDRMHWEMKERGYRDALISTNTVNYRAQLFYANCGYRFVNRAEQWEKALAVS